MAVSVSTGPNCRCGKPCTIRVSSAQAAGTTLTAGSRPLAVAIAGVLVAHLLDVPTALTLDALSRHPASAAALRPEPPPMPTGTSSSAVPPAREGAE
jgi:hypothetical protein